MKKRSKTNGKRKRKQVIPDTSSDESEYSVEVHLSSGEENIEEEMFEEPKEHSAESQKMGKLGVSKIFH